MSREALGARAGVLPAVPWPAVSGEGQAEAPVEAGSPFAGVGNGCCLGRSELGRGRGVRGQLERGRDGPDPGGQRQKKKQSGYEALHGLCGTAGARPHL